MSRARSSSAEIPQDRTFQERYWRAERIAWAGFALLLFAALSGLFGSGGPLVRASAHIGESLVEHPRFARWEASDELHARLAGGAQRTLMLSDTFSAAFEISDIQPTPITVTATAEGHIYAFAAEGAEPVEIRFALTPRKAGFIRYSFALAGAPARSAWSFIWP